MIENLTKTRAKSTWSDFKNHQHQQFVNSENTYSLLPLFRRGIVQYWSTGKSLGIPQMTHHHIPASLNNRAFPLSDNPGRLYTQSHTWTANQFVVRARISMCSTQRLGRIKRACLGSMYSSDHQSPMVTNKPDSQLDQRCLWWHFSLYVVQSTSVQSRKTFRGISLPKRKTCEFRKSTFPKIVT